jgi:hypothetical protein
LRLLQWANSNEYNGEWASGKMSGRGTFRWSSGERYDGEWKDGKEDGKGALLHSKGTLLFLYAAHALPDRPQPAFLHSPFGWLC